MNYNYVFIAPDWSDVNIRYCDLNSTDYSKLVTVDPKNQKPNNRIAAFLYRIHTSNKINKIVKLPFKHIWKKYYIFDTQDEIRFENTNPIYFIIFARCFDRIKECYRDEFMRYLRKKYKNCKIALYFSDILKTFSFDLNIYRQQFDAFFSFDKKDAFDNNFIYYPEQFFSSYPVDKDHLLPQSDVVFIGNGKRRLNEIINVFEILNNSDLKCDFYITEAHPSEQKHKDKITYGKYIPYHKILQHVISSKCILEILQEGGSSHTARVSEAICYGKKLLSNCRELSEKPYYNSKYISIFSGPNDIDIEFIKKNIGVIDYNYIGNLSPLRFIEYIDRRF